MDFVRSDFLQNPFFSYYEKSTHQKKIGGEKNAYKYSTPAISYPDKDITIFFEDLF